jgi:hypothetical protein
LEASPGKVNETLSQKQNTKQKGWRCGSNGGVLAQQAQNSAPVPEKKIS